MFDLLSQTMEFFAPFIVTTGLFLLLVGSVICSLVVPLLGYYLVRFAGFAISWQPKDYVGAPRSDRLSDSGAIPGTTQDRLN